jgi:hypothetical protein
MVILARTIGIVIGLVGVTFLIKLDWMKQVIAFWKEGNRVYWAGAIRLTVGIILLAASPAARVPISAGILGLLFLVSGIVIFVMGAEEARKMIGTFESQSSALMRLLAVIVIIFSALILSTI